MQEEGGDLSDLELIRLQNIKKNDAFLLSLGLGAPVFPKEIKTSNTKQISHSKKRPDRIPSVIDTSALRRSKRLRDVTQPNYCDNDIKLSPSPTISKDETVNDDKKDGLVNYDELPVESQELDDLEFQVFIQLRKWRLQRSRELDVEPYKIFQNRTLCESIRRRRNDSQWARGTQAGQDKEEDEEGVRADLLECWGIGPSKSQAGGMAHELRKRLNEDDCDALLKASRDLGATSQGKQNEKPHIE